MGPSRSDEFMSLLTPIRSALEGVARNASWEKASWEDALQAAITTAWERFDTYDRERSFRAWIFSILFNTMANLNRAFLRRTEPVEPERIDFLQQIEMEEAYAALLEGPDLMADIGPQVREALEDLGLMQRAVFLMRSLADLKYSQIAEGLGIPIGTVMSHLHRVRSKLRERLADHFAERSR